MGLPGLALSTSNTVIWINCLHITQAQIFHGGSREWTNRDSFLLKVRAGRARRVNGPPKFMVSED